MLIDGKEYTVTPTQSHNILDNMFSTVVGVYILNPPMVIKHRNPNNKTWDKLVKWRHKLSCTEFYTVHGDRVEVKE